MSYNIEQFNLGPGNYSFEHHNRFGKVNLEIGEQSIYIHGERPETDSLGEKSFVQTISQGVDGSTFSDAFNALPRELRRLLVNFQMEREVSGPGAEVVVFDSRAGLSVEERREMKRTGRIPTDRVLFKADVF